MIVNIYDVNHGFCGYVRDGLTGANILIDCGCSAHRGTDGSGVSESCATRTSAWLWIRS